jgi:hypothetical protein
MGIKEIIDSPWFMWPYTVLFWLISLPFIIMGIEAFLIVYAMVGIVKINKIVMERLYR